MYYLVDVAQFDSQAGDFRIANLNIDRWSIGAKTKHILKIWVKLNRCLKSKLTASTTSIGWSSAPPTRMRTWAVNDHSLESCFSAYIVIIGSCIATDKIKLALLSGKQSLWPFGWTIGLTWPSSSVLRPIKNCGLNSSTSGTKKFSIDLAVSTSSVSKNSIGTSSFAVEID